MLQRDLIVIGASAGGVEALKSLVHGLPGELPAAVCIVLHTSPHSPSMLPQILTRSGPLVAEHASDGDTLQHQRIYVAPPDHHLLIDNNQLRVVHGPWENRHRPAIDPLFRSAAQFYGPRAIGVILTGSLDDGTSGLLAIKRHGGLAVVQDPADALYPSMPLSALAHVSVDHTARLAEIPGILIQLINQPLSNSAEDLPSGSALPEDDRFAVTEVDDFKGTPSVFSCPTCDGVLWEIQEGKLTRFRCRVGHAFSMGSIFTEQAEALEEALWTALKTLEESASLASRMAEQSQQRGHPISANHFAAKQQAAQSRAAIIRQILQDPPLHSLPPHEHEAA